MTTDWWDDDPWRAQERARQGSIRVAPPCDQSVIMRDDAIISQRCPGDLETGVPPFMLLNQRCSHCGGNLTSEDADLGYLNVACIQCGRHYRLTPAPDMRLEGMGE